MKQIKLKREVISFFVVLIILIIIELMFLSDIDMDSAFHIIFSVFWKLAAFLVIRIAYLYLRK